MIKIITLFVDGDGYKIRFCLPWLTCHWFQTLKNLIYQALSSWHINFCFWHLKLELI